MTTKSVRIEHDVPGEGEVAGRGDRVTIRCRIHLNHGDLIRELDPLTFILGRREVVAGLEKGVTGMRVGGRPRFRVPPHLAYRDVGVPDLVPPNAMLRFDVELLAVARAAGGRSTATRSNDGS